MALRLNLFPPASERVLPVDSCVVEAREVDRVRVPAFRPRADEVGGVDRGGREVGVERIEGDRVVEAAGRVQEGDMEGGEELVGGRGRIGREGRAEGEVLGAEGSGDGEGQDGALGGRQGGPLRVD